jgi:hypothetical protein
LGTAGGGEIERQEKEANNDEELFHSCVILPKLSRNRKAMGQAYGR